MRPDMQHVLIDRPRHGSKNRFHGYRNRKGYANHEIDDESPDHESMKRRYGYGDKQQSDHIRPLERYLRTNCGRPWNEIYSEISKYIKLDSVMQRHVRGHVDDMVETNTFIGPDGKVWANGKSGGYRSVEGYNAVYPIFREGYHYRRNVFYVDPRTGLLQEAQYGRRDRRRAPPVTKHVLDDMTELHQIDGVWYRIEFLPFPTQEQVSFRLRLTDTSIKTWSPALRRRDVLTGEILSDMWETQHVPREKWIYDREALRWTNTSVRVRPRRFAAVKQQLGAKVLGKYKLRNAA